MRIKVEPPSASPYAMDLETFVAYVLTDVRGAELNPGLISDSIAEAFGRLMDVLADKGVLGLDEVRYISGAFEVLKYQTEEEETR